MPTVTLTSDADAPWRKNRPPRQRKPEIHSAEEIPYGYCHCGCGQQTRLAPQTITAEGWVKGQPIKYIFGHNYNRYPKKPVEERFWAKVQKSDGCWEWTAYKNKSGYGEFGVSPTNIVLAHRFSYELHCGEIPDGMFVCHKCDNPACVRPDHLWVGTAADNNRDMRNKGRQVGRTGETSVRAKLTMSQAREIRRLYAGGWASRPLGKRFGVSANTVLRIAKGRSYPEGE